MSIGGNFIIPYNQKSLILAPIFFYITYLYTMKMEFKKIVISRKLQIKIQNHINFKKRVWFGITFLFFTPCIS